MICYSKLAPLVPPQPLDLKLRGEVGESRINDQRSRSGAWLSIVILVFFFPFLSLNNVRSRLAETPLLQRRMYDTAGRYRCAQRARAEVHASLTNILYGACQDSSTVLVVTCRLPSPLICTTLHT